MLDSGSDRGDGSAARSDGGISPTPGMPSQSCTAPSPAFTAKEQMLVELPADSWFVVPDKHTAGCGP